MVVYFYFCFVVMGECIVDQVGGNLIQLIQIILYVGIVLYIQMYLCVVVGVVCFGYYCMCDFGKIIGVGLQVQVVVVDL